MSDERRRSYCYKSKLLLSAYWSDDVSMGFIDFYIFFLFCVMNRYYYCFWFN